MGCLHHAPRHARSVPLLGRLHCVLMIVLGFSPTCPHPPELFLCSPFPSSIFSSWTLVLLEGNPGQDNPNKKLMIGYGV